MAEVRQRFQQPGRLTAALRIYRTALYTVLIEPQPRVQAPTLGIWSEGDRFLVEGQMLASEKWMDGPWRYQRLSGGHWMPFEQPEHISELVLEHLAAS